jgi:hypothetical protein
MAMIRVNSSKLDVRHHLDKEDDHGHLRDNDMHPQDVLSDFRRLKFVR